MSLFYFYLENIYLKNLPFFYCHVNLWSVFTAFAFDSIPVANYVQMSEPIERTFSEMQFFPKEKILPTYKTKQIGEKGEAFFTLV
jgi:hypothetical protein